MRRYFSTYIIFSLTISLICFSSLSDAFSQTPGNGMQVKATVDSSTIKIGEQFQLILQANVPASQQLVWPQIPDSFDHLLVVDKAKIDTLRQAGITHYKQQITLTGFDSGFWKIPAFSFAVISGNSAATAPSLSTDSLFITVNTVRVDTTKPFRPIKQIREVPFNILAYWPYILGGIIVVALLIWLIFFRKRIAVKKPEAVIPQEPAYEQAVKNLHALEDEKLWQNNQVKLYYTKLTDIIRLYIQRRFNINALEQTSDELLQKVRPVTQLNQQKNNLEFILRTADLAKFAKMQPLPEDHQSCMKKAYDLLEWTKPAVEEKTDETENNKQEKEKADLHEGKTME